MGWFSNLFNFIFNTPINYSTPTKRAPAPAPAPAPATKTYTTPYNAYKMSAPKSAPVNENKFRFFETPPQGQKFDQLFSRYSYQYNLPYGLLSAIAYKETGGSYSANLTSGANAQGLMQIVPYGYNKKTGRYDLPVHPTMAGGRAYNPQLAIPYAAKYLRQLHDMLGSWDKAIAAYNAGQGTVINAIKKSNSKNTSWRNELPYETKDYLTKIGSWTGLA